MKKFIASALIVFFSITANGKERVVDPKATVIPAHVPVNIKDPLYLQGTIDESSIMTVYKEVFTRVTVKKVKRIDIIIDSPGGYVDEGLKLVRLMKAAQAKGVKFNCFVENKAYSMAAIILTYCDTAYMDKNSKIMFHEIAAGLYGKVVDLYDQMNEVLEMQMYINEELAKNLGLPVPVLMQLIVRRDFYVDADSAAKFGFVDGVFDSLL